MISGLPGVAAYLDDLIVTKTTEKDHWENVEHVFQKLSEYSLYVKCENLCSAKTFVEYLGHVIDKQGKRPSESSADAIK